MSVRKMYHLLRCTSPVVARLGRSRDVRAMSAIERTPDIERMGLNGRY